MGPGKLQRLRTAYERLRVRLREGDVEVAKLSHRPGEGRPKQGRYDVEYPGPLEKGA